MLRRIQGCRESPRCLASHSKSARSAAAAAAHQKGIHTAENNWIGGLKGMLGPAKVIQNELLWNSRRKDKSTYASPHYKMLLESPDQEDLNGTKGPCCVVKPESVEDLVEIARYGYEHSVPILIRGAGEGMWGAWTRFTSGLLVSQERGGHEGIFEFDASQGKVTCGAGTTITALREFALNHGWDMRLYPTGYARKEVTVGGFLQSCFFAFGSFQYGSLLDVGNVLSVEVIPITSESGRVTVDAIRDRDLMPGLLCSAGRTALIARVTLSLTPSLYWVDATIMFEHWEDAWDLACALVDVRTIELRECALFPGSILTESMKMAEKWSGKNPLELRIRDKEEGRDGAEFAWKTVGKGTRERRDATPSDLSSSSNYSQNQTSNRCTHNDHTHTDPSQNQNQNQTEDAHGHRRDDDAPSRSTSALRDDALLHSFSTVASPSLGIPSLPSASTSSSFSLLLISVNESSLPHLDQLARSHRGYTTYLEHNRAGFGTIEDFTWQQTLIRFLSHFSPTPHIGHFVATLPSTDRLRSQRMMLQLEQTILHAKFHLQAKNSNHSSPTPLNYLDSLTPVDHVVWHLEFVKRNHRPTQVLLHLMTKFPDTLHASTQFQNTLTSHVRSWQSCGFMGDFLNPHAYHLDEMDLQADFPDHPTLSRMHSRKEAKRLFDPSGLLGPVR